MRNALTRLATLAALAVTLSACGVGGGVTSVAIDGGDRTLVIGDTQTLSATVSTAGAVSSTVSWMSSEPAIAAIDADTGFLEALAEGTTMIVATSSVDAGKQGSITLTVDPPGALRWTRQFGTTARESAQGVATDANGHVYLAGSTFGALEGSNAGSIDAFIRSYDQDGNVRWTHQFGTAVREEARSIATDANGLVYVVGDTTGAIEGSNAGSSDAFIRAYDQDGNVRWTSQFGTTESDSASGVATDANGHVYVAGQTLGALAATIVGGAGSSDAFVRAYDQDGNVRWTRQFGTSEFETARSIATDANGHIYVAGYTGGALEGSNAGNRDAFIRSYDQDGIVRWTRQFGSNESDFANGVATDANGHIYAAGHTLGALEGPNAGSADAFVRAYDQDGNLRWTHQFGSTESEQARSVATDANGHVYLAGYTLGALEGSNDGLEDAFIRSYDQDGIVRWTRQFGTSDRDDTRGVATDANGHVYLAGYTDGALEGPSAGDYDGFIRAHGQ